MGWTLPATVGPVGPRALGGAGGDSALTPSPTRAASPATFPSWTLSLRPCGSSCFLPIWPSVASCSWPPGEPTTCCLGGRGRGGGRSRALHGCLSWLSRLRLEPWVPCSRPPFSLSGPVSVFPPCVSGFCSVVLSRPLPFSFFCPLSLLRPLSLCVCVSPCSSVSLFLSSCVSPSLLITVALSPVFFLPTRCVSPQAEPLRVVQPAPVPAGAPPHPGEPVHAGQQPLVPRGGLHAAGLGDHAPGAVHALRQRSLVRGCLPAPTGVGGTFWGDPPETWAHSYSPRQPCDGTQGRAS